MSKKFSKIFVIESLMVNYLSSNSFLEKYDEISVSIVCSEFSKR